MDSLAALLRRIGRLDDLSALAAGIGVEAERQPLEVAGTPLLQVAHGNGVPWLGLLGNDAERSATRLARLLCRRGHPALVLALDPDRRLLAVAAAFGTGRALLVRLDAPDAITLETLARLRPETGAGALATLARAADVLMAEPVGERFFRRFRSTLETMEAALPDAASAAERRALALLQLTRVLFLYFVQSKGWLDGRTDFLARQVDELLRRRRSLHRDLLRPLFFGTLNRPADERRGRARAFGAVPFLNGGLFEPHPLERRWCADLPTPLWRQAFDELFERFRFTVAEQRGAESIAPDMLGHVFERVMVPEDRRRTGTFYTPAGLVGRILDAGLAALLTQRLRCSLPEAERQLAAQSPPAQAALRDVTMLDPAAGSGAFLLGGLERLAALRAAGGELITDARRRVLQRNLFGVDVSATAVRLAELRLWLAVVADDPADCAAAVAPLPNLDCLVRQGDSLLDPAGIWPTARAGSGAATELGRLRDQLVTASGPAKPPLVRALRRAELRMADAQLELRVDRIAADVRESIEAARAPTLFGERAPLGRAGRVRLGVLRRELRAARALRRAVARDGELPWFHYQSHFADVFARGGFDLVVGNPPWVRAEELPAALRIRLAARYRWWRTAGSVGYAHRPDLSLAFLERATELAAADGAIAVLVPAKITTAGYATRARRALAAELTLHAVADLTADRDAAFDATVYPLVLVATRGMPPPNHRVRTRLGNDPARAASTVAQASLAGGAPWLLAPDAVRRLVVRLATAFPTLGAAFRARLGVKTGANGIFLGIAPDVEPELLRWALRGRDVERFGAVRRLRLIWTHGADGAPLGSLPPRAARHFARHRARLLARADQVAGLPWQLFRTGPATASHRVVWADLDRRLRAVALSDPTCADLVPLNSCYVIVGASATEASRLTAWLNAPLVGALARLGAAPAAAGFARFNAGCISRLPLPPAALADPRLDGCAGATDISPEDRDAALDAIAAEHLAVTARERRALALVASGADHRR